MSTPWKTISLYAMAACDGMLMVAPRWSALTIRLAYPLGSVEYKPFILPLFDEI